jgi:hypothetical protein
MTRGRRSAPAAELAIVLDENIAAEELRVALAETARAHNARVELIMDHFARGTLDETWLPVAASSAGPSSLATRTSRGVLARRRSS